MPMYEFYCSDCNTIFTFLSRSINTTKIPPCPKCRQESLQRQVSLCSVSTSKSAAEGENSLENLPIDESKMEQAMAKLAGEAENINEDDPRQAAQLMRKFSQMTGLTYNDTIQEALSRMEAGEDPQQLEEQLGSAMEGDDPFILNGRKGVAARQPRPLRDSALYEM